MKSNSATPGSLATPAASISSGAGKPLSRLCTGVEGLDDILHGGIPSGHLYLIEGDPGSGKTTLALQFLLEGIRSGERVLYVTLSESRLELEQVARSHGWPIPGLEIFEMIPPDEDLKPEAQYTVFHPSEVELADTIASILGKVDEVQPQRLVFDSLAELRMLARDPLKYRQILALKRYLSGGNITVLLLDDRTSNNSDDLQLQSIAHGVVLMEGIGRDYGIRRRRIEIHKLRGSAFREGYHDYVIRTGGLSIFPRLIAAEHKPGFERKPVPSGLKELDDLLRGGIDTGTSTLLTGPAGCGKSTIAFRYAYSSAQRGEKAMIFTFDESLGTLVDRAKGLGMNADEVLASPGELRQVIANIVGNAIDAMRHGGRLRVRISEEQPSDALPRLRLTIADTGSGIPASLLPTIFEPFITTKGETGTGLGLWVTGEIIRRNDWTIRVRSHCGTHSTGTAFSITMPLSSAHAESMEAVA